MTDHTPPLEPLAGQYDVLLKLQEGGMGAIYKVRHRASGEIRVVKTVHPQHAENETLHKRFQREAEAATRLHHRNLARFFEVHVDEKGVGHMVLEFIDGLTLGELLNRRRPPSLGLALEIADQTLDGLAYLHGEGFVHRDVAPDNIMVTTTDEGLPLVKLIDLGVAKAEGGGASLTRAGTFLGKVRYCAPEGFAGDSKKLTARSDLYSFGVVLYELLTGSLPTPGKNFSEIVSGHLFKPPLDFAESDAEGRVSPGLRQAVLDALEKDPQNRVSSAAELRRRLARERDGLEPDPGELESILEAPIAPPVGPSVESLLANARLLVQLQSHTEARHRLQKILAQEPDHEEARSLLNDLPDPKTPKAIPKAPPRSALPQSPAEEAVVAVERSLRLGELDQARKQLDLAISYYGDRPDYAKLKARLVAAENPSMSPLGGELEGETEPVDTFRPDNPEATPRTSSKKIAFGVAFLLALALLVFVFFLF